MVVGLVGLLITMVMMSTRRRTDVLRHGDGTTIVEPVNTVDPRY